MRYLLICSLLLLGNLAGQANAKVRVEIEIIMESRFPSTPPQKWATMLRQAGFSDVRLRSARQGEAGGPPYENHWLFLLATGCW